MVRLKIDNILAQRDLLKSQGRDFEVILTTSVKRIITDTVEYISISSGFLNHELHFIKKVRKEVIANCQKWENDNFPEKIEELKCSYVHWPDIIPFTVDKCCEVDLNAAYWNLANQLGYISDALYKEGLKKRTNGQLLYSKKARLAALGSIAKSEKRFVHRHTDNGYVVECPPPIRHEYAKAFFNVSRYVYDVMSICRELLGKDYLFLWTDAIFFKNPEKNMPIIKEVLKDAGLEWKRYNIQRFTYDQKGSKIEVTSRGHKKYKRTFNINQDKTW